MRTRTHRSKLDRLHKHTKAKRRTRRRLKKAGSLGLDPEQAAWEAEDLAACYPVGYFGPQHGLTMAQAWMANRLLARADRERPIRGRNAERRHRLRMGGIISAVRGGRVGNSAFGRSLHGHRGGRVMAVHALHHLRAIAPLGAQAAQAAREGKKALEFWERTGQVLPLGEHQTRQTLLQQLEAWERQQEQPYGQTLRRAPMAQWLEEWEQQQRQPKDFLAW